MQLHDWIGVTPTRDDFAQQLMRMAEQRGFGGWTYEASEFRLRGDEADAWVDLGDLYLEYSRAEVADRLDLLEKYLRELRTTSLSSTYRAYRAQREVLQPKMDNLYVAIFSTMQHTDTQEIYSWCTWAEDTDSLLPRTDLISFAKRPAKPEEGELEGLWVPWSEVERICGHHLRKTDDDPVRYLVKSFPSESEWRQLKQPTRDDFAQQLMRMAEQRGFGGWTYEASEFRLRGDEADAWVDLGDLYLEYSQAEAADRLDLLEKYLRELRTTGLSSTYRVQRDVLQPKMGDNLYVAIFSMMRQMDTQEVCSWCTWLEDTDSLLPRTDVIALAKRPAKPEEGELEKLWVLWSEVERICGHHLRKTDEDPVRYRVKSFPSESEWQQLKQRALPVD